MMREELSEPQLQCTFLQSPALVGTWLGFLKRKYNFVVDRRMRLGSVKVSTDSRLIEFPFGLDSGGLRDGTENPSPYYVWIRREKVCGCGC
jgi:hypothetical protein